MLEMRNEVIKDLSIAGAVFAIGAGCGAATGVGAVGGMLWSVGAAALGGVIVSMGNNANIHLNILGIVGIAAGIFGGACALKLGGLVPTFSAALLLSTQSAAIALAAVSAVALIYFLAARCCRPNEF